MTNGAGRDYSHPPPPLSLPAPSTKPQSSIGVFLNENRGCELLHSIKNGGIDNKNRDGDPLIPQHPKIAVSATLSPDITSAGAFFDMYNQPGHIGLCLLCCKP